LSQSEGDIRATIAISSQEAVTGSTRSLNLPGGRRITVPIPSGIPDGQVIRLENQGETTSIGTTGALVLTIVVAPEETRFAAQKGNENKTVRSDPQVVRRQMAEKQPSQARRLRFVPRGRAAIIVGMVALIVLGIALGSSGVFYFKYFNIIHRQSLLNARIGDPYSPDFSKLALNDPLSDNSLGNFWPESVGINGSSCEFISGGYQVVSAMQESDHYCIGNQNASNFAYQADMTIRQGSSAGVIFRADNNGAFYYYFHINVDQSYDLDVEHVGGGVTTVKSGSSAVINGQNQPNLIAVVANGTTINLYVNGQNIDTLTDSTFSQGFIGVAASSSTQAVFSNARVWTA